MNERLKVLADQAEDYATAEYEKWTPTHDFSGIPNVRKIFNEKFAELIIKECVSSIKAKAAEVPVFDEADRSWKMGTEFAVHIILEHFGVEE